MTRRIRLCQFTPHLFSGGVEERVARILGALDRERFDITWMGFGEPNPALMARAGRRVDVVSFEKTPSRFGVDLSVIGSIAEAMRSKRPDIVHAHNWSVSIYGILAARIAGVPRVVYEAAGRESPDGATPRQIALMRTLAPHVDQFTSVADFLSAELASSWGVPRDRVQTMPTGINLTTVLAASRDAQRARFGIKDDAIVVGTLGMIRPVKRVEDLIDAAAVIAANDPRITVLAIGNAYRTDPAALRARATALGIGDRLILPGRVEDSAAAVHALDVFVSSSAFEGRSNAIIEAMAAGIPVVATAVGGSPELVLDGETGFLVPPGQPARLAEAIGRLVDDPDLRVRLGSNAKQLAAERHDEAAMALAYAELYRALAAGASQSKAARLAGATRGLLSGVGSYLSQRALP